MQSIETLIGQNPRADVKTLQKALEMLRVLRASGKKGKGYDLARPFSGDARVKTRAKAHVKWMGQHRG